MMHCVKKIIIRSNMNKGRYSRENHKLIVVWGLSGCGKSTVTKLFTNTYKEWGIMIEGDDYFKPMKPKIILSSGKICSNWDDPDSVDWDSLNRKLESALITSNVVLATFIPLLDRIRQKVNLVIKLDMGENEMDKCIAARLITKKIGDDRLRAMTDSVMVKEVVYKFYKSLPTNTTDYTISVFDNNGRRNLKIIVSELANLIM